MLFEELDLDPMWSYYQNKKRLEKGVVLQRGDSWINYRSILLGGRPEFRDAAIISQGDDGTSDEDEDEEWQNDQNSNYTDEEFEEEVEEYEPRIFSDSNIEFNYIGEGLSCSLMDKEVDYKTIDY
jgi:hypothetical protein